MTSAPRSDRSLASRIKVGERDMADTLAYLGTLPKFNGRAVAMGLCYAAGISCHGTQMLDYIQELDGVGEPICIIWGDQDHRAPVEVLEAYRAIPLRMKNVEVHIFSGVRHGYMMRGSPKAFDAATYEFSIRRAMAILEDFKVGRVSQ